MHSPSGSLPTISVVVPVYNSQEMLPELVARLVKVLREVSRDFEIILVNDGSSDNSWAVIRELAAQERVVQGINLTRNYGQHNALLAGIRLARSELICTIDDDFQHPPEEIPKLVAALEDGCDVVYGTPQAEQHGFWRDAASIVTKLALRNVMGADIARNVSAFRVFRALLRESYAQYQGPFVSVDVLLSWGTNRFCAVPVRHQPRQSGQSNYTFRKLVVHALNMLTGFSALPLRLASVVGFLFTIFGMFVLLYVLAMYIIHGGSVPGFPFLASIVALFSGAQLFAIGIIGEYLARMFFRSMNRPSYVVRSTTSASAVGRSVPSDD